MRIGFLTGTVIVSLLWTGAALGQDVTGGPTASTGGNGSTAGAGESASSSPKGGGTDADESPPLSVPYKSLVTQTPVFNTDPEHLFRYETPLFDKEESVFPLKKDAKSQADDATATRPSLLPETKSMLPAPPKEEKKSVLDALAPAKDQNVKNQLPNVGTPATGKTPSQETAAKAPTEQARPDASPTPPSLDASKTGAPAPKQPELPAEIIERFEQFRQANTPPPEQDIFGGFSATDSKGNQSHIQSNSFGGYDVTDALGNRRHIDPGATAERAPATLHSDEDEALSPSHPQLRLRGRSSWLDK